MASSSAPFENSICRSILVLSGKGGVGKSTVTLLLARQLASMGHQVGVLDIDLCGPSLPKMLGLQGTKILQDDTGWKPVLTESGPAFSLMSLGFFLEREDDPVIWRGPKKTSMVTMLLEKVAWGKLDFLLVDTPPGTSDEHISILEALGEREKAAVIVTTPQLVALNDVRREISFCHKLSLPLIGLIENMSGLVCPNCGNCTNLFSCEGGKSLAAEMKVKFLGALPISLPISWGGASVPESMSKQMTEIVSNILSYRD